MKRLAGLLVVLIALVLGSYFAMGWFTERALKKSIEIVNQSNGIFVEILDYHRGWFIASTHVKAKFHVPTRVTKDKDNHLVTVPEKTYEMTLPITIHHGPIIYTQSHLYFGLGFANIDVRLPKEYVDYFNQTYTKDSTQPELALNVFVNYLNKTTFQVNLPAFTVITKDAKNQFHWLGAQSDISISAYKHALTGTIKGQGATLVSEHQKIDIGPLESEYNLHASDAGLYVGDAHVTLSSFNLIEDNQNLLNLNEFSLSSSSDVDNQLFHSDLDVTISKAIAHDKSYGPAHLAIALKNLDAPILSEINRELSHMQPSSNVESQRMLLALLPKIPQLLSHGAELKISDLSLHLPEGAAIAHLSLILPSENTTNVFQLIQNLQGDCKIEIPADVLKNLIQTTLKQKILGALEIQKAAMTDANEQTQPSMSPEKIDEQAAQEAKEKIAMLLKNGLLAADGAQNKLELKLNDGHLTVNGKPFTPAMLQL